MSSFGDAIKALKTVILIEDNLSRLGDDVRTLTGEIRNVRDYAQAIDSRLSRLEGQI